MSLGIFQLQGDVRTPELQREQAATPGTDAWRFNNLSHPHSNTSLKVGETRSVYSLLNQLIFILIVSYSFASLTSHLLRN